MGVLDPIDLTEVAGRNHRYQREWFELRVDPSHPMQQQPVSGEIELSLKLRYNPALEYEPFVDEPDEFVEKANELLVAVAHGRSLAVRDKNLFSKGGGSDARAVLCFGDKQFRRTTVQKKTLYPIWREEFSFELLTPAPAVLKIRCEDYDELSSSADSMGVVDVDLTALLGDKRVRRRQWYALEKDPDTPPNLAVSGEIELILRCRYNATLDFQPFQEPSDFPNKRPNELLIAVVQGRGLAVVHDRYLSSKTGGSSDLRVILRVTSTDAECRTTRVAKKQTERPRWLETFRIPVEYADDCPQALMVQCVDQSSSAADSMGVVRVDLAPLARDQERIRKWFPLEADPDHPSEAASGELELVLRYIHNPEFCSFEPFEDEATINDHSPNELLVGLVRGRDLATKDSSHLPSPQVTFCISGNDTSYQSTVRNKTLFPIWHETFRLPIFWADENDETFVSIRCEHLDEILSQATPIGEIRIFLKSLSNQQLRRQWFPLRAHDERHNASGALELVLRLRYNPDLVVFEPFTNPDAYVGRNPNE
ncbi:hypothetical protein CTAYLR_003727 [Chrysophaeum taylorii]|uniref:C2 domain-containing protein n=1 Tax=Chrysophaeum taylorii TaxID=2483200 RepID=A0AAD7UMD0_9STRA|nr:hypothetical protein CTAYLR_003727 [Chrysophaeum taylorii]